MRRRGDPVALKRRRFAPASDSIFYEGGEQDEDKFGPGNDTVYLPPDAVSEPQIQLVKSDSDAPFGDEPTDKILVHTGGRN